MSQRTQDRRWEINLLADEQGRPDDDGFEARLMAEMAKAGAILHRLGGAVQSYVVREQGEDGLWYPVKVVFKWSSFVPGIRAARPAPAPSVDDLLDEEPEVDVAPEDGEPVAEDAPVAS